MRRDFAGLEKRRLRAAALFEQGCSQAQVAEDLTVSRQSVSRWHRDWKKSGEGGLKAAGRAGRLPRLGVTQRSALEKALVAGPRAAGHSTELWTLPRVAKLIRRLWGVSYHPGHVWRILRNLGWSCQRPATRAKERNEEAIRQWRRITWPQIKKGRHDTGPH
jgi:transposase